MFSVLVRSALVASRLMLVRLLRVSGAFILILA